MTGIIETRQARDLARRGDWLHAWPLGKPALATLATGTVVLLVVWTALGVAFMAFLDDGPVGDADRAGARWLEEHRTPAWDSVSHVGSMLSDTLVKVVLVAVVGGAMVVVWRRWHDGVFLAVAVSLEAFVFVTVSFIVGRERPPVDQLDPPAPSGSFPSGHAGAAVAFYTGLLVIVCWHTRNRAVRAIIAFVAVAAPLAVGVSRTYRGMHHPIDVVAGLLLGLAALAVTWLALAAGTEHIDRDADHAVPERARRLDLTTETGDTND